MVPFGVLTIVVSSQSGALSGTRFWKNDEPVGAVREPLHEHRPSAHRAHQRFFDREVVLDEVELGLAALGEHHLVRAGDADGTPGDVELDVIPFGHVYESKRSWRSRCWSSTISGSTKPMYALVSV